MNPVSPGTRTLPSQTELLRFVDQLALARGSELARAGKLREASRMLLEDRALIERSPEACDLLARICLRLGRHDDACFLWKNAARLSGGAEPYRSAFATFQNYAASRKRRRRALVWTLARRKARRLLRKLASPVTNGLAPFLKRKLTGLLCRQKNRQPTVLLLPAPAPAPAETPTTPEPRETKRQSSST